LFLGDLFLGDLFLGDLFLGDLFLGDFSASDLIERRNEKMKKKKKIRSRREDSRSAICFLRDNGRLGMFSRIFAASAKISIPEDLPENVPDTIVGFPSLRPFTLIDLPAAAARFPATSRAACGLAHLSLQLVHHIREDVQSLIR